MAVYKFSAVFLYSCACRAAEESEEKSEKDLAVLNLIQRLPGTASNGMVSPYLVDIYSAEPRKLS